MRIGSILSLIGGLLIVVNSILSIILAFSGTLTMETVSSTLLLSLSSVALLAGIIVLLGMFMTLKARSMQFGAILIIAFSIVAIFGGGGFFLGTILGVVGGALILVKR